MGGHPRRQQRHESVAPDLCQQQAAALRRQSPGLNIQYSEQGVPGGLTVAFLGGLYSSLWSTSA